MKAIVVESVRFGEMSEWFKEHAWKACVGETPPWVRIPLSPLPFPALEVFMKLAIWLLLISTPSLAIGAQAPANSQLAFEVATIKPTDRTGISPLAYELGTPVMDKTGLTGLYDVKMQWVSGNPVKPALFGSGTIFAAVQDLGLRLVSTKGPLQVVVIDDADKPSPN